MFKSHPFLSISGFTTFLAVTLVLGLGIWWKGDILFSPGDLTAQANDGTALDGFRSHAEFEASCERCHTPFVAVQNDLCLDCHLAIKDQVTMQTGTHASLAADQPCRSCHPDHRGRTFNALEAAFTHYDHSLAGFSLNLHETDYEKNLISCYDCHIQENGFMTDLSACEGCHAAYDPAFMATHLRVTGEECLACHDGLDSMADFNHAELRFSLLGQHLQVACADCHPGFVFEETPLECFQCHTAPESHLNRFPQECQACHSEISWREVQFDHAVLNQDCILCHQADLPPNHYGEQCRDCHSTEAWLPAAFDHQRSDTTDCLSCHPVDRPQDHYEGLCSLCHTTQTWEDAVFDHTGQTECQSCHQADAPVDHYPGQCSLCHNTDRWDEAEFNHAGQTDCQSCHASDAPPNHFPGQCSACHVTENWGKVSFNHAGFPDCITCHLNDRPSDHDDGQCSQCHNTIDWEDADDDRGGGDDNGGDDND